MYKNFMYDMSWYVLNLNRFYIFLIGVVCNRMKVYHKLDNMSLKLTALSLVAEEQ